jgi:hypothetical protein
MTAEQEIIVGKITITRILTTGGSDLIHVERDPEDMPLMEFEYLLARAHGWALDPRAFGEGGPK